MDAEKKVKIDSRTLMAGVEDLMEGLPNLNERFNIDLDSAWDHTEMALKRHDSSDILSEMFKLFTKNGYGTYDDIRAAVDKAANVRTPA